MKKQELDIPRIKLKYIIKGFGPSVISEPKRCEALLRDLCPEYKREISVLIAALKERVPWDIVSSRDIMPEDFLISQLTRRLYENLGIAEEFARWAVVSWLLALESEGKPGTGTEYPPASGMRALSVSEIQSSETVTQRTAESPGPDPQWWEALNSRWKRIFRKAAGRDQRSDSDEWSEIGNIQSLECYTPWFPITDLEPLVRLKELKKLDCSKTRVSSLKPLAASGNLEELICRETPLTSLEPLGHLPDLQILNCSASQIGDLEPLRENRSLRELYCSNTRIRSLEPIRNLSDLEVLDCDETDIRSLEPLENLRNLRILNCSSNRIGNLEPLRDLEKLRVLNCNFNRITDLKALRHLNCLEILNCNENCIGSLEPLRNLTALQILNVNGNPVVSLDPLGNLNDLRKLGFEETRVSSLEPLYSLMNLQKLYCRKSGVGIYERLKFNLKNPLCDLVC